MDVTATRLGLGTALVGAIVISGLVSAFLDNVQADERVPAEVAAEVETALTGDVSFVSSDAVAAGLDETDLDDETAVALVDGYEDAQLQALRAGLFAAAAVAFGALLLTSDLPSGRPKEPSASEE